MNNKGQALVEFVLILPIFIFLLFTAIDFGIIFNEKNKLENDSLDIVNLYNNGTTVEEINNIFKKTIVSVNDNEDYFKITIKRNVKLRTPGLGKIMGSPYTISVERVIPHA